MLYRFRFSALSIQGQEDGNPINFKGRERYPMKKKIAAIAVCAAMTVASAVPAFASVEDEMAAAAARASQLASDYEVYQSDLVKSAMDAIAKGMAERAAGEAAIEEGTARIAEFYASELSKGAQEAAAGQEAYNAYQSMMASREQDILAQVALNEAEREKMAEQIDTYLRQLGVK